MDKALNEVYISKIDSIIHCDITKSGIFVMFNDGVTSFYAWNNSLDRVLFLQLLESCKKGGFDVKEVGIHKLQEYADSGLWDIHDKNQGSLF